MKAELFPTFTATFLVTESVTSFVSNAEISTAPTFYVNMVKSTGVVASASSGTGVLLGTANPLMIGINYENVNAMDGKILLIYIWNRRLIDSAIQQLYLSPYQFIRPVVPMPYWIAAAAPAAGVPKHMDYYRRMRAR